MLRLNAPGIRSLLWAGDRLIDWVGGVRELHLDGTFTRPEVHYPYRFDAAVAQDEVAILYERLGTKGLVLKQGEVVREIDRSFYHANVYEYPIALFRSRQGRILLAHCPDQWNRIEIEDALTGERISNIQERKPDGIFHSRLRANSDGSLLLSAGWYWHPWSDMYLFDVEAARLDSSKLDRSLARPSLLYEVMAAEFVSRDRVLIATGNESSDDEAEEGPVGPNSLAILDVSNGRVISSVRISEPIGLLMAIDEEVAVGFHTHPKLFSLRTGEVLKRWKEIDSGNQCTSILLDGTVARTIATDPGRRRFAVAGKEVVWVVHVDDPDS